MYSALNILIGKKIKEFFIDSSKKYISFICMDSVHVFKADGECCADSYIESIDNGELLNGSLILDISAREVRIKDDIKNDEVIDITFYSIKTDKGYVDIHMRTEHNGYYGGSIEILNLKEFNSYKLSYIPIDLKKFLNKNGIKEDHVCHVCASKSGWNTCNSLSGGKCQYDNYVTIKKENNVDK